MVSVLANRSFIKRNANCQQTSNMLIISAALRHAIHQIQVYVVRLANAQGWMENMQIYFLSITQSQHFKGLLNLHSNCYYGSVDGTCKEEQPFEYELCSEQSLSYCQFIKEGHCTIRDGKCQEIISCSEVKNISPQSYYSYSACNPCKEQGLCLNNQKCSENEFDQFLHAKEKIYSDVKLLRQSQEDQYIDYDPTTQTRKTCIIKSKLNYHWNGNRCTKCNKNSFAIAMSIIGILGLSI